MAKFPFAHLHSGVSTNRDVGERQSVLLQVPVTPGLISHFFPSCGPARRLREPASAGEVLTTAAVAAVKRAINKIEVFILSKGVGLFWLMKKKELCFDIELPVLRLETNI